MKQIELKADVVSEPPKREYEIDKLGNVKIDEVVNSKISMAGREFITFYREHEKILAQLNVEVSEDFIAKKKVEIERMTKEVEMLKPLVKEVDDKMRVVYQKFMKEQQRKGKKKA